jgi:hypothetical protein
MENIRQSTRDQHGCGEQCEVPHELPTCSLGTDFARKHHVSAARLQLSTLGQGRQAAAILTKAAFRRKHAISDRYYGDAVNAMHAMEAIDSTAQPSQDVIDEQQRQEDAEVPASKRARCTNEHHDSSVPRAIGAQQAITSSGVRRLPEALDALGRLYKV